MPSRLVELPAELKLQILELLRLKDILTLKKTCRGLNELISQEKVQISNQIQLREIARLQDFVYQFSEAWAHTSFLEALNRWVGHRGIHSDGTSHNYSMRVFAETWYKANFKPSPDHAEPSPAEVLDIRQTVRNLADAADKMVKVHVQYHVPGYENIHEWENGLFAGLEPAPKPYFEVQGFVAEVRKVSRTLDLDDNQIRQMFWDLRYTPSGRLEAKVHPFLESAQTIRPPHVVTRPSMGVEPSMDGFCSTKELTAVLGVPALPSTGMFAYYTRSGQASVIVLHAVKEGKQQLRPFDVAAAMESLFIY